jgi:16S rRNA (uracil1498-N3)-methyltransferase
MRRSRVYTPQQLLASGNLELEGPAAHYLLRVLRLSAGDPVTLFNGDGRDYQGEICQVERQCVVVRIIGSEIPGNESSLKITLVQAISRGERMDFSLQKATELGVVCVQPLTSSRVEVRLDEKRQAKRLVHWQGVVISACEQSGRAIVPEIKAPLSLDKWLAADDGSARLVLDPQASISLSAIDPPGDSVSILVGPEGGFSSGEMEKICANGVRAVSLGPRVLRTETAGPAAISVLQIVAGDF